MTPEERCHAAGLPKNKFVHALLLLGFGLVFDHRRNKILRKIAR
jgi:hypothetical protein